MAALSTVENNYLMNGYMAKSLAEELPCPGLSVKFLVRIEDVTARVNGYLGKAYGKEMETRLDEISYSGDFFKIQHSPHDRLFAPMLRCIVLRHEIRALFRGV